MQYILAISLAIFSAAAPQPAGRSGGLAIPLTKHSTLNKSASLDALKSHAASVKAKIRRHREDRVKNGAHAEKRGNSVPLTDNNDMWHGPIEVGSDRQTFTVGFDTGSSDLFLPIITGDEACKVDHHTYDPTPSTSSLNLHTPFDLVYEDGSKVSGSLYNETVYIADSAAIKQTFLAATACSEGYQAPKFVPDGIVGMAFGSMSSYKASPVFETLVKQGAFPEKAFSFKVSEPGELYLGGSNTDLYNPDPGFVFTTVKNQGFWEVTMDDIEVDGYLVPDVEEVPAVIDTGTPFIYGPAMDVAELYHDVEGAESVCGGIYTIPCNAFPSISLTFSGTPFPIPESSLKVEPSSSSPSNICASTILASDDEEQDHWVIGVAFLESVYTRFDYDGPRGPQVGFAPLEQVVSQPSSSSSTSTKT